MACASTPELTWANYPGITQRGRQAAEAGLSVADCPHDLGTPQHQAWVRGFLPTARELRN